MSTNASLIQVGGMEVQVVRKPIKNLHLSVLPPNGRIRVTCPVEMKDATIRALIATRVPWIHQRQQEFEGQERQSRREYVSGESHYLFGKRYRLERVEEDAAPTVYIKGASKIVLQVRPGATDMKCEEVMRDWYRADLRPELEKLVLKWQKKIGIGPVSWNIKHMKTRWGTCNPDTKHVWFNLELAKKPHSTIEYVVVHELLHIKERKHNERFVALLDKYLPKWRNEKDLLNKFILSHEEW